MSYTQTQLAALRDALASGALTVTYEGKTITYRSLLELQKAISIVERSLGVGASASRSVYPAFTRDGL